MDNIQKLHHAMQSADAIIIGAGAGLSTSAGSGTENGKCGSCSPSASVASWYMRYGCTS
ncbi:MAG: hypothetical protein J6P54_07650 [Bacteroidales bacterium]|nr:hypothetical protein [Bacteroidales bacterium]